ncbi:MAG TPA: hypothetical protein VF600_13445 [Abditibacteriaceae bacterium]
MKNRIAARWWSQALHNYHNLCTTAAAEGVTMTNLPAVNEKQLQIFETALRQQLQQQMRKARRKKYKNSKAKRNGYSCEAVLFVDDSGLCNELAQAAQVADINGLEQMLPEHMVMVIYTDQVQVSGSNRISNGSLDIIWSAQEETALQNSLKALSKYLGIAEKRLRLMVDAGQLQIQQRGGRVQFACDGITSVIDECLV